MHFEGKRASLVSLSVVVLVQFWVGCLDMEGI